MRLFVFFRSLVMDFRAWRRGERRIVSRGTRGRIYERKNPPLPGAGHMVETKTTYKTLARVIHADGRPDEHYDLTENMKLSSDEFDTLKGV